MFRSSYAADPPVEKQWRCSVIDISVTPSMFDWLFLFTTHLFPGSKLV